MRPVIAVFAKAPLAGHVKTRLQPAISPRQAAELHSAFVRDTLRNLLDFPLATTELHTDIETDAWRDFPVPRRLQHEGDLGLRMLHALDDLLAAGCPQAIILGSDSPDLPAGHLARLLDSSAEIALGPSLDGGYYAIAARRTHPAMFDGVHWSSPDALNQTVFACRSAGLSVETTLSWHDLDTPADLALLDAARAPNSAAALAGVTFPQPRCYSL